MGVISLFGPKSGESAPSPRNIDLRYGAFANFGARVGAAAVAAGILLLSGGGTDNDPGTKPLPVTTSMAPDSPVSPNRSEQLSTEGDVTTYQLPDGYFKDISDTAAGIAADRLRTLQDVGAEFSTRVDGTLAGIGIVRPATSGEDNGMQFAVQPYETVLVDVPGDGSSEYSLVFQSSGYTDCTTDSGESISAVNGCPDVPPVGDTPDMIFDVPTPAAENALVGGLTVQEAIELLGLPATQLVSVDAVDSDLSAPRVATFGVDGEVEFNSPLPDGMSPTDAVDNIFNS